MSSIRVVLCLDANMNLKIEQLDVKIVFIHGGLDEEIYMEQPKRVYNQRQGTLNVLTEEEIVWSQAGTETVVQKV